jgi:hypothetical protein
MNHYEAHVHRGKSAPEECFDPPRGNFLSPEVAEWLKVWVPGSAAAAVGVQKSKCTW